MNVADVMWKVRARVPFTGLNIMSHVLDKKSKTILDVGCGSGGPIVFLNRNQVFSVVCADIFKPYLDQCKKKMPDSGCVLCDARALPFSEKSFDTVLCIEVLEHMEKEEGLQAIAAMEHVAKKQVILATPLHHYKHSAYDNNPYQEHKYIWRSAELKKLGYRVIAFGMRGISDNVNLGKRANMVFAFKNGLWVLAGPLTRLFPNLAGHMVCVKQIG
jgi:ubiquinone/menaquinone biosynthesis C-methylase UbiE